MKEVSFNEIVANCQRTRVNEAVVAADGSVYLWEDVTEDTLVQQVNDRIKWFKEELYILEQFLLNK